MAAFAAYLPRVAPGVHVGDSGELALAATVLGIAHPPGYPLWALFGRVVVVLGGAAEPAFALNVFSAVSAAVAVGLLAALGGVLTRRPIPAAGCALAFGLSHAVWSQAVVTEVYALNLALSAGALLAMAAGRRGRPRLFLLGAYLVGLGAANHPLSLFAAPVAVALALGPNHRSLADRAVLLRRAFAMAAAFLLGLSVYFLLPIRFSADPSVVWGGMQRGADLFDHVIRAQYGGLGDAEANAGWLTRWTLLARILWANLPAPLALAAIAGPVLLFRRGHAKRGALLAVLLVLTGPVLASVLRFEDTFRDRTLVEPFFLQAVMAVYLAAAAGLGEVDRLLARRLAGQGRVAAFATATLALIGPVLLFPANAARCDRSDATLASFYAETVFRTLPPRARLFAEDDNGGYILAYHQRVLGARPDVILMDRTLHLFVEHYGEDFLKMSRVERKLRRDEREAEIVFEEPDRPVYFTGSVGLEPFGECRLVPQGVVMQLVRPGEAEGSGPGTPVLPPPSDSADYLSSHLAATLCLRQAMDFSQRGRTKEARACLHEARRRGERIAAVQRVIGETFLELGDPGAAEARWRAAIELEPGGEDALYSLAVLLANEERTEESIEVFERLVALGTELPEAHLSHGIQLVRAGRLSEAAESARLALAREPGLDAAQTLADAVDHGLKVGGQAGVLEARNRLEPLTTGGVLQLAQFYMARGEISRATELYREAFGKSPDSVPAAYGLGYGLLSTREYDDAAAAFRAVLAADSASADGRNALAYIFAQTGDSLARAETLAREALDLAPENAGYWRDTLGWVLHRAGRPEDALRELVAAAGEIPKDDPSMQAENDYHRAEVLLELGRIDDAREAFLRSEKRAGDEPWVPDLRERLRRFAPPGGDE
jgi:tetratricopeptide (TPR) repeat protein